MLITKQSALTGKMNTREIDVTTEQLLEWKDSGRVIQDVLPHLSDDDREFLLSGSTPEEWKEAFGDEEDEEGPHNSFQDDNENGAPY